VCDALVDSTTCCTVTGSSSPICVEGGSCP
jgi:hypothetical protein